MDFPRPGRRIAIRGLSGSGKTTLGNSLSEILGIPHTEMDSLFWKANWTQSPDEEFFPKIEEIVARDSWILCGNYSRSRHLIDPHSDTVVWLDYQFWLVLSRLVRRSFLRGIKRQYLWGHCRESLWFSFVGKDAIVWWIFRARKRQKAQLTQMFENPEPGKIYVRLRHPRETEAWLSLLRS